MDRLDERRKIAAVLDEAEAQRRRANEMPEVIAARAAMDKARAAADVAAGAFNRVFRASYPRDDELQAALLAAHPDLVALGYEHMTWLARCAVTGLPIFKGDRVIETRMGTEDYQRTLVLADAVTVDPALCLSGPVTAADAAE